MKKGFVVLFVLGLSNFGLKVKAQSMEDLKKHYLSVFQHALKYNDADVAINALNGYLSISEDVKYKDTLSMLYAQSNKIPSSILLSTELYNADPKNIGALARLASGYQALGNSKESLKYYEQLCAVSKEPAFFYQMAVQQFMLKRFGECEQTLAKVLSDTSSKKIAVVVPATETQNQQVPLIAAGYFLAGSLKANMGQKEEAVKYYQAAYKEYPDYYAAKATLTAMAEEGKKKETPAKKEPVKGKPGQ